MKKPTDTLIQNTVHWLEIQIRENPFSDVGILFSIHNGFVVRVTKTISAKEKTEGDKK